MAFPLKVFAGSAGKQLTADICRQLKIKEGEIYRHVFPSGEHYCQYLENIRGCDVFLIQPVCNPAFERIMELLVMIDAAKRASAGRITVVTPYLGYLRQDRKTKSRTPITARLIADLLQTAGAQRVVGMDFHCEQAQGFFNIPVDHLYGAPVFIDYLNTPIVKPRLSKRIPYTSIAEIKDSLPEAYAGTILSYNWIRGSDRDQLVISDKPYTSLHAAAQAAWAVSINTNSAGVWVEVLKNRYGAHGPDTAIPFPRPIIPQTYVFRANIGGDAVDKLQDYIELMIHQARAKPIIVSPDAGGIKRASAFAEIIGTDFAFISKKRLNDTDVKAYGIVGDVENREVLIVDDMTESCGTIIEAAKVCKQNGATVIRAAVTHGLLNSAAASRLSTDVNLKELITTDTSGLDNSKMPKVKVLSTAKLFATAISHINQDKSITELFQIKGF